MESKDSFEIPFSLHLVTYQCGRFLPEAIESALSQTFKNFELIIVNDGSTDETREVLSKVKDPRVRIFETSHLGLIPARNLALKESKGTWSAIWDADDISLNQRLEICWKSILEFGKNKDLENLAAVSGQMIEMTQEKRILNSLIQFPIDQKNIEHNLGKGFSLCHGASVFRTDLAREVGGYRQVVGSTGEDEDLFIRLQREGHLVNLPDFLIYRRIHPRSLCNQAGFRVKFGKKDNPSTLWFRNFAVYFARIFRARLKNYW
jgi:glycosyltransferase involved in cell wall biosynthesis